QHQSKENKPEDVQHLKEDPELIKAEHNLIEKLTSVSIAEQASEPVQLVVMDSNMTDQRTDRVIYIRLRCKIVYAMFFLCAATTA
ncbi:hypothetical protein GBAR_LOCUS26172, partial [Geodia barretti]